MQVVADGVPHRLMDMPTERIVDRRQRAERRNASERRKPPLQLEAPVETPVDPWPTLAPTPTWNRVVFVSLATFVFGVLLTMTVDRFTRHARAKMIAQSPIVAAAPPPVVQPVAPPVVQPVAPPPATSPALVVRPIPPPSAEPTTLPAPVAAPAPQSPIDLRPRKMHQVAKAPAARPRQPVPATSRVERRAAAIATTPPPLKAPRAKWVDPFAD